MNDLAATCRYAWYGDDFTGATDTLANVAGAGLRALLFLGVPRPAQLQAAGPLDAVGIAGAARAMGPVDMAAELAPVGPFFAALGVPVLHYKCCSTFDSAPGVGNLGVALRTLQMDLDTGPVAVVGGQPSLGRFCAFGNLFGRSGVAGEVFRIDRHPTMSRHPVTPMHEADLRRHLAAQGLAEMPLIDLPLLDGADDTALDAAIDDRLAERPAAILFDVTRDEHLERIGRWLWQRAAARPVLALGASSVAQALVAHWRAGGELAQSAANLPIAAADGPVFVLAGSQSPVTARQVQTALATRGGTPPLFHGVPIDVDMIVHRPEALEAVATQCAQLLRRGDHVLAYTDAARAGGPAPAAVAQRCARLLGRVLEQAPEVRRVGVAGGDTSSMAVRALGLWALAHAGILCPGMSLTRARADAPGLDGLELMLKGGQMGPPDLFERLLRGND